ncbi:MAG: 6-bladed beta-propeller [Bacteroidales bacterium]|nr:6-bladed beta-propeller [Bacteroidales bacterium]
MRRVFAFISAIFLFLPIGFISCDRVKSSVDGRVVSLMDATTEVNDLGSHIRDIEVVHLAADSVLLGIPKKMLKYPGGFILMFGGEAFGFDDNGQFLHKYGRIGRGPGEYMGLTDICLDNSEKSLLCLTTQNEIMQYSIAGGDFERKIDIDIDGITADAVFPMDGNHLAIYVANPSSNDIGNLSKDFYCVKVIDKKGKVREEMNLRTDFNVSMAFLSPSMQNGKNTYTLSYSISSGPCYLFDSEGMSEICFLDLGQDALPDRFAFTDYDNPWRSIGDVFDKPYYKCPSNVGVFEDFIYCSLFYEHSSVWNFITDGDKGIRWLSVPEQGQPIWPIAADGQYLYYVYSDYERTESSDPLKKYLIYNKGLVLHSADNPAILKVRFML